jgi:hypothetical protein
MTSINFATKNENNTVGLVICGLACAGILALGFQFGIVLAGMIAAGALFLGGKILIAGMSSRP